MSLSRIAAFSALFSSTESGRLYSGEGVSPPGLSDIRRASSLTNRHCVGLKEKPPRSCQNKSPYPVTTLKSNTKHTYCELSGMHINIFQSSELFRMTKPIFCLLFADIRQRRAFIVKASARYGSAFRILFKAACPLLYHVLNTIIRKCRDVSNSQPATTLQQKWL